MGTIGISVTDTITIIITIAIITILSDFLELRNTTQAFTILPSTPLRPRIHGRRHFCCSCLQQQLRSFSLHLPCCCLRIRLLLVRFTMLLVRPPTPCFPLYRQPNPVFPVQPNRCPFSLFNNDATKRAEAIAAAWQQAAAMNCLLQSLPSSHLASWRA